MDSNQDEDKPKKSDLDTYWLPHDILDDAIERICEILESVRVEGVYGVIALGMYDVMNDSDLLDVRSVGSKTACSGLATFASDCLKERLMGGITQVSDGGEDGFEEIGVD